MVIPASGTESPADELEDRNMLFWLKKIISSGAKIFFFLKFPKKESRANIIFEKITGVNIYWRWGGEMAGGLPVFPDQEPVKVRLAAESLAPVFSPRKGCPRSKSPNWGTADGARCSSPATARFCPTFLCSRVTASRPPVTCSTRWTPSAEVGALRPGVWGEQYPLAVEGFQDLFHSG